MAKSLEKNMVIWISKPSSQVFWKYIGAALSPTISPPSPVVPNLYSGEYCKSFQVSVVVTMGSWQQQPTTIVLPPPQHFCIWVGGIVQIPEGVGWGMAIPSAVLPAAPNSSLLWSCSNNHAWVCKLGSEEWLQHCLDCNTATLIARSCLVQQGGLQSGSLFPHPLWMTAQPFQVIKKKHCYSGGTITVGMLPPLPLSLQPLPLRKDHLVLSLI